MRHLIPVAMGIWLAVALLAADKFLSMPAVVIPPADTNTYHLTFTWDAVTNAQWYYVRVRSNGVEVARLYSMTNRVVVSNLIGNLDVYQFTCIATNVLAGESDDSIPAPKNLTLIQVSNDLTNWTAAPAVQFDPTTNARNFLRLTNWDAQRELRKD